MFGMYYTLVFFCFTETIKERVPDTHEIEADHLLETCNISLTLTNALEYL